MRKKTGDTEISLPFEKGKYILIYESEVIFLKKPVILIVLIILGLYWLLDHTAPLPLNHESFGLYEHNIHRVIGVVFLIIAAVVAWKWQPKKA